MESYPSVFRFLRIPARILFLSCIVGCCKYALHAQASPTASKVGDLQAGVTFDLASPDTTSNLFKGFGLYSTFDFTTHFGIEAEFHQLSGLDSVYERTYEIGPRYVMHFGAFSPYAKLMAGRGVFNYPPSPSDPTGGSVANLAYYMEAAGIGADYSLRPSLNLRVDYEFQRWNQFPISPLTPSIFSVGVAYHFH